MNFKLRKYMGPNFNEEKFLNAPNVLYEEVKTEGVAPDNYHAMSIYPEYFKIDGKWILAKESRMDGVVVINYNLEKRNLLFEASKLQDAILTNIITKKEVIILEYMLNGKNEQLIYNFKKGVIENG